MTRRAGLLLVSTFAWWTLNGLVWAAELAGMRTATGETITWAHALRTSLASAWLWVPLTLGLVWLVERHPIERPHRARAFLLLVAAVMGVVLIRAAAVSVLNAWIGWYDRVPDAGALLLVSVANNLFPSWLIIGVAHALLFAARASERGRLAAELQGRLADARLEALSAQLQPHFLFNALNSIAELVHRDPSAADRMLVGLGALLRRSLDTSRLQEVALREELRLLAHYVELEKVRLGDRLLIHWHVDPALLDARVPPLVLQPLVENAIHHAISRQSTTGRIQVRAGRVNDRLVLEVQDEGGPARVGEGGNGVGLANTRARLQCLYGSDHELRLGAAGVAGGTVAHIALPFRPMQGTA